MRHGSIERHENAKDNGVNDSISWGCSQHIYYNTKQERDCRSKLIEAKTFFSHPSF